MPRLLFASCLAFLLSSGSAQADEPVIEDPGDQVEGHLQRLVGTAAGAKRTALVATLAKDQTISLDLWRSGMVRFGSFTPYEAGMRTFGVDLGDNEGGDQVLLTTYVPRGLTREKPARLLMAFPGTGGDGRAIAGQWKAVAEALGMLVVAVGAKGGVPAYTFHPDVRRTALRALRWARLRFNVDERRIFATGISRGGHLTWDLALRHPGIFAGVMPMIGGPRRNPAGGQNNIRYLENVVSLPIRDLQGANDDQRLVASLRGAFRQLAQWKATDAKLVAFPNLGHSYDFSAVDWPKWIEPLQRPPPGASLVRMAAREEEGRHAYVEILKAAKGAIDIPKLQIDVRKWKRWSEPQRNAYVDKFMRARTARLAIRMDAPGHFVAKTTHVRKWRLLLTPQMLGDRGRVEVFLGRRTLKRTAKPDKRVLLREFAEHFDRTFLPTCELKLP